MKYQVSSEEKAYAAQTLVEVVKCSKENTPDFLIGIQDNCVVKVTPEDVETPASGNATLAAGTVTIANTSVTATSRILLTYTSAGGTQGFLRVTKNAGVGFTITSSSNTDVSTVDWVIFN